MARIEGSGAGDRKPSNRLRLPKLKGPNPLLVMAILSPVAMLAPDAFLRSVAVVVAIGLAFLVGYYEGRSAHAREMLADLLLDSRKRPDDRRDNPAA